MDALPSAKGNEKTKSAEKNEVESWEGEMYLKKVVIPQLKGCTIQHVNNDKV